MLQIIVGNVLSLIASCTDAASASSKTPKGVLGWQTVSQVVYGSSALLMGAPAAATQNLVNILRNTLAISGKNTKALQWVLATLALTLGLLFNQNGLWDILPVGASLLYSLTVIFHGDDEKILKIAFAICLVAYTVFNLYILNIFGAVANGVVLATTFLFLIRDYRAKG